MNTTACLSRLPAKAHAVTAPGEPVQIEHRAGSASVGIALAWFAFFAIAMGHSLATSQPDVLPRVAQAAAPR